MIIKILCWLGIHDWVYYNRYYTGERMYKISADSRKCWNCQKTQKGIPS